MIVAVLDSGTEFTHEDLGLGTDGFQNIWLNPGEDPWSDPNDPSTGNGIDDDSNGYVDDWKGYDFNNNNNDPRSTTSHGTMVAGVVSSKTNNATGVASLAGGWTAAGTRVMAGGLGDAFPNGEVLDDGILYGLEMGANVIQLSLSVGFSQAIDDAIQMAVDNNLMVICASGNTNPNGQPNVRYPASNPNVMAIGATNQSDQMASFSDHGQNLEISAPGVDILTTTIGNSYTSPSGTSFSSPLTSSVVALMWSVNPDLSNSQIRQILKDTADKVGGYDYNWDPTMPGHSFELGYGRLNAEAAVAAAAALATLEFKRGFEEPVE